MVQSSWRNAIVRVYPVHMMNADSAPGGHQPSDQANVWIYKIAVSVDGAYSMQTSEDLRDYL